MRTKPRSFEYEILDRLDEIQIQTGDSQLVWKLKNGLCAISYAGMARIAKINHFKITDSRTETLNGTIVALVEIRHRIGASQCEATPLNIQKRVAEKKAYRNAIRQVVSPNYLRYALTQYLEKGGREKEVEK